MYRLEGGERVYIPPFVDHCLEQLGGEPGLIGFLFIGGGREPGESSDILRLWAAGQSLDVGPVLEFLDAHPPLTTAPPSHTQRVEMGGPAFATGTVADNVGLLIIQVPLLISWSRVTESPSTRDGARHAGSMLLGVSR